MELYERVNEDIKIAMKAKEKEKLEAIRMLKAKLIENKTAERPIAELDVAINYTKKLKDALIHYPDGTEQKEKILREIDYMRAYLPEELDEARVRELIAQIKAESKDANLGLIMKQLTPMIKGKFDGKRASELVKEAMEG
jgi:uncharacterized protein YqeY